MRKREVEMARRAASKTARDTEFFLIGSQSIHAHRRRPPVEVLLSQECDLYPKNRPETDGLLDAELGRGSRFARRHGFYVDVVTPELASLPVGWQARLKPLRVGRITALCLEKSVRRRIQYFPVVSDRDHLRARLQSVLRDMK